MTVSRRHFMKLSAAAALGFKGLNTVYTSHAAPFTGDIPYGYGDLVSDPSKIMDLPAGFSYKIIARRGEAMSDGLTVPGAPDGMAAFPRDDGKTIVVCNHELDIRQTGEGPFGENHSLLNQVKPELVFDIGSQKAPCLGGTSTIIFDTKTQTVDSHFMSLLGTARNCAGGSTPWNSWITCEETVQRAEDTFEQDHGYNFEVPASAASPVKPVPLKEMGRFNHEAVAVDEKTGIVYETEDRDDGLIYRFIPNTPGQLEKGGNLQILAVIDHTSLDTRNWNEPGKIKPGQKLTCRWIDAEDVQSPNDDLRYRGFDQGGARFARGEGMWAGDDGIYFACTSGGHKKAGQIWKYVPSPDEGTPQEENNPGELLLFVEPNDRGVINNADNLTVSPWGDLIVCEDCSGPSYLDGVAPSGDIYKFARNVNNESELAGVCFSPDGSTLFVNIQNDGLTLAVTGPWRSV